MDAIGYRQAMRSVFHAAMVGALILFAAVPAVAEEPDEAEESEQVETDEVADAEPDGDEPPDEQEPAERDAEQDEQGADEDSEPEAAEQPAAPDPRVFVLPADSLQGEITEIVTERINESIRSRLESLGGIDLLPTFEALIGEAGSDAAHTALARAEREYTSGIGLVNAGQYEEAAEVLQRAVQVLTENVADLHNFDILTDAMLNLAIAHAQTGYDLDARDNIRQYAQLVPEGGAKLEDYPEVQSLYDAEVERVQNAGHGTLNISANRERAQVYINGELKGETPLVVEGVGFGEHFMVVRRGDWIWSDKVRVRGRDQEETVEAELRHVDELEEEDRELPSFYVDLRNNIQSGQFGRELEPYFQELANQTGADFIAWTLILEDDGAYAVAPFIYRVEDAMVIQGENVIFNRELSNLRSRANALSDTVAASVIHMPESQQVDDVDLVPEPEEEPAPVADAETDSEREDEEVAMVDEDPPEGDLPVPGPTDPGPTGVDDGGIDELPDEDSNTMRYLGWGGAAAAATGVIAGTVFLLMRGGDPAALEAEVEW